MKKLIILFILSISIILLPSCSKFDETKTDSIYAQIVVKGYGKINLKLAYETAPITVKNFIKLAKEGFYDKTIFHRVIEGFMIQGGGYTINNGAPVLKSSDTIKGEFSANGVSNRINHKLGVISMARANNMNSASSQFFICSATASHLDGQYAAFGYTTDSASNDVVVKISKVQTELYSDLLQDYPSSPVVVTKIKLANKAF